LKKETQSQQQAVKKLEDKNKKTETDKLNLIKEKEQLKKDYEALKLSKAKVVPVAYAAKVSVPSGDCVTWMQQAGITDIQNAYTLILRESGCRVNAQNASGAYGIPQSLPASKMASAGADYLTNPVTQLRWFKSYCENRYGSIANALAHSQAVGWY